MKTYNNIKTVLGVKINDVSGDEALKEVESWLDKKLSGKIVVTPGPEFLVTAQKDEELKKILNSADLSLPDGFGLNLYAGIKNRIPGREFMVKLCGLAAENDWSIGLVGGWKNDGQKIKDSLEKRFPKIKILTVIDGDEATAIKNGSDIDKYIKQDIDILFVGFGHPYQEKVLNRSKKFFKVGMGVGGSLDYLAGRYPEPPKFLQVMGLEWLWRLVTQPRRVGRILKATFSFPIMLWVSHVKK